MCTKKVDECCLLPSEVQIPNHTAYCPTKSLGMSSSILFSKGSPHQFQFGVLPLKWWVGVEANGNWMDGLRLLWLGRNPAGVKICNRCGCTTLLSLPPRSTANKAWDQRWQKCCPCGGRWKVPAFLPQPKAADADFLNHL
ncbi:Mediator of RNA polymerase II transcription subunit 16 [Folsomia candida]|uniref:Mediator of RNA polymerase II transcription subunit 16 n=1 Tax=Folsomia candida TaxID=158441 RepID=A0A226D327_FOLCA|nr:Mediator of RNA polymerase II transcription subunit 16 [Folsomia candida]